MTVFGFSPFNRQRIAVELFLIRICYSDKRINKLAAFVDCDFKIFRKISAVYFFKIPFLPLHKGVITCVILSENYIFDIIRISIFLVQFSKAPFSRGAVHARMSVNDKIKRRKNYVIKIAVRHRHIVFFVICIYRGNGFPFGFFELVCAEIFIEGIIRIERFETDFRVRKSLLLRHHSPVSLGHVGRDVFFPFRRCEELVFVRAGIVRHISVIRCR